MGILSTGLSLVTDFFPQAKAIFAGGSALVIVGVAGYLYFQQASRLNQINLLQQQNSALTNTVSNLQAANAAYANEVKADKLNTSMITAELSSILQIDEENQAQLVKTEQYFSANKAKILDERNSPATQQAYIANVNANIACFFATFTNMEPGACIQGKFVQYSLVPSP